MTGRLYTDTASKRIDQLADGVTTMRHLILSLSACLAFGGTPLIADDKKDVEVGDRERVVKFLKANVIGKTVASPKSTFTLDGGKMEGEAEEQVTYTNFNETETGFSFDTVSVSKEARYDLNKDGKRVGAARQIGGTTVDHVEFGERASTKKLTGTSRTLTSTTKHQKQEGTVILITNVKLADGTLTWAETQPGYGDYTAAGGKLKPGSYDATITLSAAGGKLRAQVDFTRFDVDPVTLKRTPEKDKVPPFVSMEIDQK
jgi:hypothetical protein